MMFEAYGLFLGTFLDALIGPNLVVAGEPFLLAAGYQLHKGLYSGLIAVLLGGFLGDQISFCIGRYLGVCVKKKLTHLFPRTRRIIARGHLLMKHHCNKVLCFARLLGPIAWVVPFIAGVEQIGWRRFSLFSFVGLILGVGQFVGWGWLLAVGIENFPLLKKIEVFILANKGVMLIIGLAIILGFGGWKYWVISKKEKLQ